MIIHKDVYLYLTNFTDDQTTINMLSVNKQFRNDNIFERIFTKKYPLLGRFNRKGNNWKSFYIEMVRYIKMLKDNEYLKRLHYTSISSFNPKIVYCNCFRYRGEEWRRDHLMYVCETGDINLVKQYESDIHRYSRAMAYGASKSGNIELLKYIVSKDNISAISYGTHNIMMGAIESGSKEMIEYAETIWSIYNDNIICFNKLRGLIRKGDLQIIKEINCGEYNLNSYHEKMEFLEDAVYSGNLNLLKYIIRECDSVYVGEYLSRALDTIIKHDYADILKYLVKHYPSVMNHKLKFAISLKIAKQFRSVDIINFLKRKN